MNKKTRSKATTLSDVAKDAGVSPMTVSRVINGDHRVRSTTREKVTESIDRLKYTPNVAARNLAGVKSLRICVLYGNPSSAYLGELLMGALETASEVGANLIIERTDESVSASQIIEHFHRDWDALIVPPPISDVPGIRRLVASEEFPTVFISSATEPGRALEIRIDDYEAARQVTELLVEKGHRRIGFIKGHPNQTVSDMRYRGYCDALAEAGLKKDASLVTQGFFTYRSGLDAADELLEQSDRPTAIFASNDDMAAGVLASAARHGLSVPRDVSVVGFDDSPIATTVWPNLTTVRQPVAEMASQAVSMVVNALRTKSGKVEKDVVILDHHLIARDTVSSPGVD